MAVPFLIITVEGGSTNYDTFHTWGLIPSGRLTVAPAAVQEKYLEIPGRNGELDISEIQAGKPLYKNRTGTWEFSIVPYGYSFTGSDTSEAMQNTTPAEMVQTIYNAIHGKRVSVGLYDDLSHRYKGRLQIKSVSPGNTFTKISIGYVLEPEKVGALG